MPFEYQNKPLLITNNLICSQKFSECCICIFNESWSYLQVLQTARNKIHEGYDLLTHPLAGSMKPNQTPYRSLLLAKETLYSRDDFDSLAAIESALNTYIKFQKQFSTPNWAPKIKKDFRDIDLSLMQGAVNRISFIHANL